MKYLHILGLLVFLAASGSTFDRDKQFYGISKEHFGQLTIPEQKPAPVELLQHKISFSQSKRQSFTAFDLRVIRLLRKLGLLNINADQLLDTLEKDKNQTRLS
ncbi:uncharacterized protein LOC26526332 [Drosophila erecta]|uniref:Uncharacterized protein n=1 Tax=Drosophila erecta TaxID=7220 RepID=A0A0Q5T3E4_DROER|nr:uncharacterized protein LOC26526332 [Drosophila erecta]KQS29923.1 uncharacterized protein Dere_GG26508 [Drosophila erecta]